MEDREKIIGRIKDLLRMANDTSSPHEAAIAARRARSLIDKHQVGLHEIGAKEDEFDAVPTGKAYRFMPMWKDILAVAVGKFNDCKVECTNEYYAAQKSFRKRIIFKGFRSDVIVAGAMYEYLCDTIDRLCAAYVCGELGYTKYQAKIGDAYKKGASHELCSRLRDMMAEREREMKTSTGTSLVVIKVKQVEERFGEAKYVNKKLVTREDADTMIAKARGREDGSKISLNTQLQEEDRPKVTA